MHNRLFDYLQQWGGGVMDITKKDKHSQQLWNCIYIYNYLHTDEVHKY
jgi:hypothetical protein